jgi:hypothetical protein
MAIQSVGSILEVYDQDKQIPVFGFGAMFPKAGITQTSHCFPLTGDISNTHCNGIQSVNQVYINNMPLLSFSGPTNFAPVINEAVMAVGQNMQGFFYSVLLILTDGLICDIDDTINAIVDASRCPLSIIIVGVGDEDFSAMTVLDGDKGVLRGTKGDVARDIVQFVEFNDYKSNPAALAQEVLKEVPHQITSYFRYKNIAPPM